MSAGGDGDGGGSGGKDGGGIRGGGLGEGEGDGGEGGDAGGEGKGQSTVTPLYSHELPSQIFQIRASSGHAAPLPAVDLIERAWSESRSPTFHSL